MLGDGAARLTISERASSFFCWRFIARAGGINWTQLKPILSLLEDVSLWELVVLYLILTTKRNQLLTLAHTPANNFLFKTHASFFLLPLTVVDHRASLGVRGLGILPGGGKLCVCVCTVPGMDGSPNTSTQLGLLGLSSTPSAKPP